MERYVPEEVVSGGGEPAPAGEAASFERAGVVVQEVDDVVAQLGRYYHRG